jgi:hypothetical protein
MVRTDSGDRLTSYPMGTVGSSPEVKRMEQAADDKVRTSVKVKKAWIYIHPITDTSSWLRAQLVKHKDISSFHLTFIAPFRLCKMAWSDRAQHRKLHINDIYFLWWRIVPHAQPPSWRTTSCQLSAAAYSMYSQLTSITGGRASIRDPRTRHAVVTGTHLTT